MEDLDPFLTRQYVMVDDVCKPHQRSLTGRPGQAPGPGISELITLALFGQ